MDDQDDVFAFQQSAASLSLSSSTPLISRARARGRSAAGPPAAANNPQSSAKPAAPTPLAAADSSSSSFISRTSIGPQSASASSASLSVSTSSSSSSSTSSSSASTLGKRRRSHALEAVIAVDDENDDESAANSADENSVHDDSEADDEDYSDSNSSSKKKKARKSGSTSSTPSKRKSKSPASASASARGSKGDSKAKGKRSLSKALSFSAKVSSDTSVVLRENEKLRQKMVKEWADRKSRAEKRMKEILSNKQKNRDQQEMDIEEADEKAVKAEDAADDLTEASSLSLSSASSSSSSSSSSSMSIAAASGYKEVRVKADSSVRLSIERVLFAIAQSILSGGGFSYWVHQRSSGNVEFIEELERVVLKDKRSERTFASLKNGRKTTLTTRILSLIYELCVKNIHVTKRDLFYTDVKLFQKQNDSDDVLEDVAVMIGATRNSLNVVASEKGVVVGQLQFYDDEDLIDCTRMGVGGKAIPPNVDRIRGIRGNAKFILLVEKDAAFMRLAEDRFYNQYPCIIITGKGQPDVGTRLFVKRVRETLMIPIYALMDADPYGLKILSVYMSGSKNMSYDSLSLTTPDIKWLGVRPSDLAKYSIPQQCRLPLSDHDIKMGKELLQEEFIKKNPQWHAELELMIASKEKAEIQALSNFGFQYLTNTYLPLKLQQADWI